MRVLLFKKFKNYKEIKVMKKFLVILMVVAMTSFLFVGCLPTPDHAPIFTSTPVKTATVGTMYTYTPTATDADADTVTFAVAGPTGMAISAGVITWTPTAAQIGTETVVVTASDGTNAAAQTFTIVVKAASVPVLVLVGIAVDPEDMDLIVEGGLGTDTETITSVTATYEVRGGDVDIALEDCLFLTSDSEVATVEKFGGHSVPTTVTVTAEGVGVADILVEYEGKFATLEVTVVAVELDHIVVLPPTMTLGVEEFKAIESVTAHYNDETKDEIYLGDCDYKSSDTDVAVVDKIFSLVAIWALEAGTADITVSYTEGGITKTDIVEVTVSEPGPAVPVAVTGVTLDQATMTLTAGGATGTLEETVTPAGATDKSVTWASSNETFAVVAAGVVTSLNAGVVAITVTTVDGGFEDICVVTVTAAEPPGEKSEPPHISCIAAVGSDIEDGGYVNEEQAEDVIMVCGHGLVGSEIQVYINGVKVKDTDFIAIPMGRNKAQSYGDFAVLITKGELDVDEVKTLKATATQYGLAESDFSDEFEFTLDRVAPKIAEIDADIYGAVGLCTVTVTFDEGLKKVIGETETAGNWGVTDLDATTGTIAVTTAELTSDNKVVKLGVTTATLAPVATAKILFTCTAITDLAGNPAADLYKVYVK